MELAVRLEILSVVPILTSVVERTKNAVVRLLLMVVVKVGHIAVIKMDQKATPERRVRQMPVAKMV